MSVKKVEDSKANAAGGAKRELPKSFFVRVPCPHCGGLHNVNIYEAKGNKMRVKCTSFGLTSGNTFKLKLINDGSIPADFFAKK